MKVGRVDFGCLGLLEIGRLCEGGCYFRMRGAKVSIGKGLIVGAKIDVKVTSTRDGSKRAQYVFKYVHSIFHC